MVSCKKFHKLVVHTSSENRVFEDRKVIFAVQQIVHFTFDSNRFFHILLWLIVYMSLRFLEKLKILRSCAQCYSKKMSFCPAYKECKLNLAREGNNHRKERRARRRNIIVALASPCRVFESLFAMCILVHPTLHNGVCIMDLALVFSPPPSISIAPESHYKFSSADTSCIQMLGFSLILSKVLWRQWQEWKFDAWKILGCKKDENKRELQQFCFFVRELLDSKRFFTNNFQTFSMFFFLLFFSTGVRYFSLGTKT